MYVFIYYERSLQCECFVTVFFSPFLILLTSRNRRKEVITRTNLPLGCFVTLNVTRNGFILINNGQLIQNHNCGQIAKEKRKRKHFRYILLYIGSHWFT